MTVTYSLDVANTKFCGFTKLLGRWKGSIYKILWKEFLVFIISYSTLSITYRCFLDETEKRKFEQIVIYFETFVELIPLSFVLGFYVSLVIGRWWEQFDAIPWPDRLCYMIGAYVHGSDDRSRLIRRTLGRYLILLQAITFQSVSTAVKKRFPTSNHLVAAGLMTKEERTIYEKLDAPYGKWWLPAQWFTALIMRAKKEGRVKDSILLDGIFRELLAYRSACGTMFNYDWISVPLVYTQVVTLATYTYSVALVVGRQFLDTSQGYERHKVDIYVPVFTLLQFFFYVGWLKVAEQIVNPYGEDDDDFELNWCLDRNSQIVYLLVDHFQAKHPKLRRDVFWDELLPRLPQTKITATNIQNPQLGSAFNMEVDPADSEFLPIDTLLEEDSEANIYSSDSVKQSSRTHYRPSFLMNILNNNFRQSVRKRSAARNESFKGYINPSFSSSTDKFKGSNASSRKPSTVKKQSPTHSRSSSISFQPSIISRHRHKSYDLHQPEMVNGCIPDVEIPAIVPTVNTSGTLASSICKDSSPDLCDESNQIVEGDSSQQNHMPPIPEEPSRVVSAISLESAIQPTQNMDDVQNLVAEASKVLEELNRVVSSQDRKHHHDCELKGYESCCSLDSSDSSEEEKEYRDSLEVVLNAEVEDADVIIDITNEVLKCEENKLPS